MHNEHTHDIESENERKQQHVTTQVEHKFALVPF